MGSISLPMTDDLPENTAPLVVLGAGQRCGSTLVQRLLCSHPQVRIWGEHVGQLRPILAASQRLRRWTDTSGAAGRAEFAADAYRGFIANLTPERADIDRACAAFVEQLFAVPARAAGRPVWGFKEVRYGLADVLLLRELFPRLRVILVVRDPRDVVRSLDDWERAGGWDRRDTEGALRNWVNVAAGFAAADTDPVLRNFVLPVRYEDLVPFKQAWTKAIAGHCGLAADLLDMTVFDRRVHTVGPRGRNDRTLREWSQLPAALRALVDDDELRMVASAYGYDVG
jgi:hypothetical protein